MCSCAVLYVAKMSIQKNNVADKGVDSMKRLRNNQEENNPCYKVFNDLYLLNIIYTSVYFR